MATVAGLATSISGSTREEEGKYTLVLVDRNIILFEGSWPEAYPYQPTNFKSEEGVHIKQDGSAGAVGSAADERRGGLLGPTLNC